MKNRILQVLIIFLIAVPVYSADVQYLLIGGGGGSGCAGTTNGGGNAGQLLNGTSTDLTTGTYPVSIGNKGYQDCTNSPYVGVSGEETTWHTFTATGGQGGTGQNTVVGGDGAGANNSGCSGGIGLNLSISTTTRYYAGGGMCYNSGGSNGQGYDWYGGGADANDGTPKKNGVAIFRYLTSEVTATGGATTTDGLYTIHIFESSGDFIITAITGGSGTSTGTSTATSTISSTDSIKLLGSLAFGQAVMISILFIGVIAYIYNSITPKKKKWQ